MIFFLIRKIHYKFFCPKNLTLLFVFIFGVFSSFSLDARSPLQESLGTIQSRALNGDPHYQGVLALFHKFGERGLAIDLKEAERWAKLAAEKEGAVGLCTLACAIS